jgi:hypothetical protein
MQHKIFLSHNHTDKPVVEPVAVRLAAIFGQGNVFYDSWSILPGDGIIEEMSKGLDAPDFVFFFVSNASLNSKMVKLEWQNALYEASNGQTRVIPVRVDGSPMPAVLRQTLYIDMHTIGLEAAISQIVSVAQGNASFTPQHLGFSNLTVNAELQENGNIDITIRASHLMEPNPHFMVLFENSESEVSWSAPNTVGYTGSFQKNVQIDGCIYNGATLLPMNATLTPAFPVRLRLAPNDGATIKFHGVCHQVSEREWIKLPNAAS